MIFASAQEIYLAGRHTAAINALQRYLAQYPTGANAAQATFFLAESLRATGRLESAADAYQKVIRMKPASCLDDALRAYAQINYDLQHYKVASDTWRQLIERSRDSELRLEAYTGLMRSAFGEKDYPEVIQAAQAVGSREARFLTAKANRTLGERAKARALFEELATDTSDAYGAESAYILVLDAYDHGDFAQVERRVYAFSDSGSPYRYWLAKSFITLGDSFADRGDLAQAEATFTSILDGYQPTDDGDDVPEQVRNRLNMLKTMKR